MQAPPAPPPARRPRRSLWHRFLRGPEQDKDADSYTWVAAAVGSNNAAGYQFATGSPVMAVGGFNGSDPAPTLEQFQRYVAAATVDGVPVYDLTEGSASSAQLDT